MDTNIISHTKAIIPRFWTRLALSVAWFAEHRNSQVSLYTNGDMVAQDETDAFFSDTPSNKHFIGDGQYIGYIYQLNIHAISKSSFHVDPTSGVGYCTHCPPSECLINCKHNEYLYNGVCLQCPCEFGCIRGSDCKNNIDPLCQTFNSFIECDE